MYVGKDPIPNNPNPDPNKGGAGPAQEPKKHDLPDDKSKQP